MKIPISHFVIKSDFREDREGIGELALSIKTNGLLQPIVVEQCDNLFEIKVGRRRFTALKEYLKLEFLEEGIHFLLRENIDSLTAQLTENLNRENFKPVEVARLVKAIHDRGVQEHGLAVKGHKGGWGIKDTAKIISKDKAFVSRLLKASQNEDLIIGCDSLNEAVQAVERATKKDLLKSVRKAKISKSKIDSLDEVLENYVCMDAVTFLKSLPDNSIDLIYTDPPYGVDLDAITADSYKDDIQTLMAVLKLCVPEYGRVLRPDKYIIIWASFIMLSHLYSLLKEEGFTVMQMPIIWNKLNTAGRTMQVEKSLAAVSECAIYAAYGPGAELTIKGRGNVFTYPTIRSERIHVAQKPESLSEDIINIFSRKHDVVLDTFSGSSSTLRACLSTERNFIGCEKDEEFYERGISYTLDWIAQHEQVVG